MAQTLIQVKDLKKYYNGGDVKALDGVTVDVYKGDVIAVIGPSGGGKSTFLRSLNLLETPTSGSIIFDGVDITGKKVDLPLHRQKMGMVFQHFNLFPNKTVLDNLTMAPIKIKKVPKSEAEQKAIRNGAAPGSVEVTVEVDTQRNVIRAIAVGATELRSKNRSAEKLTEDKLLELAAENLSMDPKALHIAARSENMCAVTADKVEKKLFGLMKKTSHPLRLIDEEGVIRLQKANATVRQADISSWRDAVAYMLEELTVYNDGGTNYPNVYIVLGKRIIDLSGMSSEEQIYSLANVELNGYDAKTPVIVAATLRIDS